MNTDSVIITFLLKIFLTLGYVVLYKVENMHHVYNNTI